MSLPTGLTPFIHFDASDSGTLTLSGSQVTAWANTGTNGGNAVNANGTVTSGTDSYNGKNLISFPSYSTLSISGITIPSQAVYFFIVTKLANLTDYGGFLNNYQSGGINLIWVHDPPDNKFYGGPNGISVTQANNMPSFDAVKPRLLFFGNHPTTSALNAIRASGTNYPLTDSTNGNYTGNSRTYLLNNYNSTQTMGEMLIYSDVLSDSQIESSEGYLSWKWGIQEDLPNTHPYYPVAVGVNTPFYYNGVVSLSWGAAIYTLFKVYRDTQISGATKVLLTTTSSTSYSDTTIDPSTTYYYFVEGALQGTYSDILSTAQPVSVPTPQIYIRPAVGPTWIRYQWETGAADNVTYILTCQSQDGGSGGGTVNLNSNANFYVYNGVTTGKTYECGLIGLSSPTLNVSSYYRTVTTGYIPDPPLSGTSAINGGAITLSWNPPAAVQIPPIGWFVITDSNSGAKWNTIVTNSNITIPFGGSNDIYRLQSVADTGYSGYTDIVVIAP